MDKKAQILDRAARMALIKSGIEKNANAFTKGKDFLTRTVKRKGSDVKGWTPMGLLGVVAAGVMMNQFISKLISYGENKGIEMQSPVYYRKMLKANPQVMEMEPEEVARLWSTLYKTSPHLAQDPVAAGGFITQSVNAGYLEDHGAPPIDTYKTLTELENKIQDNRDSGAANAFGSIAGALSAGAIS